MVDEWHTPTVSLRSSFYSESVTLAKALRWLSTGSWTSATIACDRKSRCPQPMPNTPGHNCTSVDGSGPLSRQVFVICIPSHCSLPGYCGEKENHKLDSLQLSRKGQVSVSRPRRVHHPLTSNTGSIRSAVRSILSVGNAVWGLETVEDAIVECPRIQLPEPYLIVTNPLKELELCELWKAKPYLPGVSQPGQFN